MVTSFWEVIRQDGGVPQSSEQERTLSPVEVGQDCMHPGPGQDLFDELQVADEPRVGVPVSSHPDHEKKLAAVRISLRVIQQGSAGLDGLGG